MIDNLGHNRFAHKFSTLFRSTTSSKVANFFGTLSYFAPSVFLISIGILALVAPKLLGVVAAMLFLFLGIAFLFVALKLRKFFKSVDSLMKNLGNQVVVRTFSVSPQNDESQPGATDQKKIIIH